MSRSIIINVLNHEQNKWLKTLGVPEPVSALEQGRVTTCGLSLAGMSQRLLLLACRPLQSVWSLDFLCPDLEQRCPRKKVNQATLSQTFRVI